MNQNKNCAQEIRQVKVPQVALPPSGTSPKWHFPQVTLPPSGTSPNWHLPQLALPPTGPRLRLKSPNCRYTPKFWEFRKNPENKNSKLNKIPISEVEISAVKKLRNPEIQ